MSASRGKSSLRTKNRTPFARARLLPAGSAHAQVESQGEPQPDELAGVRLDPGAPVQGLLQAVLDVIQAVGDLAARQVDGLADVIGARVQVGLGRGGARQFELPGSKES